MAKIANTFGKGCDFFDKDRRLCRRDPFQGNPPLIKTELFQQYFHQGELAYGFVITRPVMAFAKMSAAGEYAGGTVGKAGQQKGRLDPASAHYPDRPDMGRILQSADAGRVSSGITAPVT